MLVCKVVTLEEQFFSSQENSWLTATQETYSYDELEMESVPESSKCVEMRPNGSRIVYYTDYYNKASIKQSAHGFDRTQNIENAPTADDIPF